MLAAAEQVKRERALARFWALGGWVLAAVLLCCQTDRPGRRNAAEPVGPVHAAEPAPPESGGAAAPDRVEAGAPAAPFVALSRPKDPLNVILLTVEALRADLPWSGYPRAIAPRLTQLVGESTLWERHRSVSSHTPQSLAALLSGRYPSSLYRDGALFSAFSSDNSFLPELLQAKGIRTLGVQSNGVFAKGRGFEQGFDVWELVPGAAADPRSDSQSTSEQSVSRLISLLGQQQNVARQFFVWAHLTDPHEPYVAPPDVPEFGKQARDRYDAEVFFVDRWIGKLLDFARTQPWWGRTAVIVTGDHGEAFGEHGMSKHGLELWDVLLETPLIIHAPGAKPTRVTAARTHIDLAPTILELMGVPRSPQLLGQSLVAELYGAPAPQRPVLLFELCEDVENPGWRALLAGDDKLVVPSAGVDERLFNLKTDPRERENLAEKRVGKLQALAVRFEREWTRVPAVEPHGGMKLSSGRLAQGPEHSPR